MSKNYCVFKVSPSGIQRPLYYGSEEDCRRFCETKDYEFIDEENVVWYLEIDSKPAESEISIRPDHSAGQTEFRRQTESGRQNESAGQTESVIRQAEKDLAGAGIR